jgi:integrase
LGKISQKQAEAVTWHIEKLVAAKLSGHAADDETSRWLANLHNQLREKLASVGLVEAGETATLGQFVDDYIKRHSGGVKEATVTTWRQCKRLLLEYFDADTPLRSISEGDAVEWRAYLVTRHHDRVSKKRRLAEATVRRRCGCAKTIMQHAVRKRLINSNPFDSKAIPTTSPVSAQKQFIDADLSIRIMEAIPGYQMRLVFALARWGGARVPSEPKLLTLADVDWENMRITLTSPKTEHHPGRETRQFPLFPELVEPLRDAFEQAEPGQQYVLPMLQDRTGTSLRKPLLKAIKSTGGQPWPKLWTALRATRDTELREHFPSHVVTKWIGHDDRVAERHYLQVTDTHFEKAVGLTGGGAERNVSIVLRQLPVEFSVALVESFDALAVRWGPAPKPPGFS